MKVVLSNARRSFRVSEICIGFTEWCSPRALAWIVVPRSEGELVVRDPREGQPCRRASGYVVSLVMNVVQVVSQHFGGACIAQEPSSGWITLGSVLSGQ